MIEYDVFISKNSKDLDDALRISALLKSKGLRVFESSVELGFLGSADYAKEIDFALEHSKNLLVLCSDNELGTGENDDSKWVYYEWSSFRNELLSKRKKGNLVIVLSGANDISSLAYGLRKYEVFPIEEVGSSKFVNYFVNEKEQTLKKGNEVSMEDSNNQSVYLKAFDFGLHLSENVFAQQQGADVLYDIQVDYENFSLIPAADFISCGNNPEMLVDLLSHSYGDIVGKYFQFGQRTGLLSIIILFIKKGSNLTQSQKDLFITPFLKEGRELCIPEKILLSCLNLISNESSDLQIVNFHKVIRNAIVTSKNL